MTVKAFDIKAVIKHLEAQTELASKVFGFYSDEIDSEEKPDKPYIFVSIVSDTPDPLETKTRVEFRIISENENTPKRELREIDNLLVEIVGSTLNYNGTFFARNVVVEE